MVSRNTCRNAANSRVARLPDDRAVIGCAVTALAALLLVMLAGATKAEQPTLVCWSAPNGGLECENGASIAATCQAINGKHELCAAMQGSQAGTPRRSS